MDQKQKQIDELRLEIKRAEQELEAAKRTLLELTKDQPSLNNDELKSVPSNDGKVIEGIFNGENMVGPEGKIYPVPANYASKSKLVEGDKLKLTINTDGSFLFKQIGPIERRNVIGTLKFENNAYHVEVESKNYNVLYASVTYHKAKPGDKVVVVIPATGDASWSVLESIIHDIKPEDKEAATKILEEKVAEEMKAPSAPINTNTPETSSETSVAPDSADNTSLTDVSEMSLNSIVSDAAQALPSNVPVQEAPPSVSPLAIDNIEIKGPNSNPIPESVNPAEYSVPTSGTVVPNVVTGNDSRADAISEMEI